MSYNKSTEGSANRTNGLQLILFILLITCISFSCNNNGSESDTTQTNHEIHTSDFDNPNNNNNTGNATANSNSSTPYVPPVDPITQDSLTLVSEGYEVTDINNGAEPDCFNYTPQSNHEIDNKLIVEVGGGTDVAIKIMSFQTGRCIRYFFINSNSTYTVRHIPEARYYLKIAYGRRWMMSNEGGQCKGKFLRNAKYEKGDDVLDFNIKYHGDSYQIPSFQLRLDVISTDVMSSFDSENISESEFNN